MSGGPAATRVLAVARYLTADLVRSQRFLLPPVAYAGVLAVLFTGDPGPAPAYWAASALAAYPVATWLTIVVAGGEDPVQRTVTVASAGGHAVVAGATVLVALAGDVVLVALAVLAPLIATPGPVVPHLGLAIAAHLACALAGTAVGLLTGRPLLHRVGWSFCVAALVVLVTGTQGSWPPVGTAVTALSDGGAAPLGAVALAAALVAASAVVTIAVYSRR
ncbi:MAG TPA: hypothetical protein VGD67_18020 [Pseudonocardiaceae bacterium]